MQVHLALIKSPTMMRVSWTNNNGSDAHPTVAWGTEPGALTSTAAANTTTYTEAQMCGAPAKGPAFMAPGQLHTAVMTGLIPGIEYNQRRDDSCSHSDVIFFWSAPHQKPTSISSCSDTSGRVGQTALSSARKCTLHCSLLVACKQISIVTLSPCHAGPRSSTLGTYHMLEAMPACGRHGFTRSKTFPVPLPG